MIPLYTAKEAAAWSDVVGLRCFVYWNSTRGCWSLRACEGPSKGKVIAHAPAVFLTRCKFKVSEAGRQRVIREGRKNVHAGVEGTVKAVGINAAFWESYVGSDYGTDWEATYHPYVAGYFRVREGRGIIGARACYMGPMRDVGQWMLKRNFVRALGAY